MITRDRPQAASLVKKVKALGGVPIVFSTIKIVAPIRWTRCDQALKDLKRFDWIVFTSANSVRFFMQRAQQKGIETIPPHIAVIGKKTASEIAKYGHQADIMPSTFNVSGLLSAFSNNHMAGKHILVPGSNIARKELTFGLRKRGANVCPVCFYRTVANTGKEIKIFKKYINTNGINFLTFFSPSAFIHFFNIVGNDLISKIKSQNVIIAAIGPTTTKEIERTGLSVAILPDIFNEDSLLASIRSYLNSET